MCYNQDLRVFVKVCADKFCPTEDTRGDTAPTAECVNFMFTYTRDQSRQWADL